MSYSYVLVLNSIGIRYPLLNDLAEHNDLAVISVSFRETEDVSFLNMISLPHYQSPETFLCCQY